MAIVTIKKIQLILIIFIQLSDVNLEPSKNIEFTELLQIRNFGYQLLGQLKNIAINESASETPLSSLSTTSTTAICLYQLHELSTAIQTNQKWSFKLIDAWGSLPSGILYGNNMAMGNFDECVNTRAVLSDGDDFVGKYCLSKIPFKDQLNEYNFKIGICIPAACDAGEFDLIFKELLEIYFHMKINATVKLVDESNCVVHEKGAFTTLDWAAIGILICLVILMILSTIYDYSNTYYQKNISPLFASFSLRRNIRQLFHITSQANSQSHVIPCLNGIRCMSIIWIIFGHCYMFLLLSPSINAIDIVDWVESPFSMFLQSGTISVDSFFFLSGLLLVLVMLREMERNNGKLSVIHMYLHRYLRLTPVLALAVLLYMTLYRYMGNGPIWNNFVGAYELCEETWWATLIYVQNYAAAGKMCLGHSWYLAVDTQLFVISPLVLLAIWKWKKKGITILIIIGLLLVACLFSIIVIDKFSVLDISQNLGGASDAMPKIYYSTHTRASPWIIGIIFGYFLYTNNGRQIILSKLIISIGWTLSLALLFTMIFSLYPKTQSNATPLTPLESAFYLSLGRIAWPLALCWIVFACINGYGGPINQFLSWSLWQPISKLSYCMYIWHLLVISANAGRIKTNTYFSDYDVILRFWGDFGVTIFVSMFMYLAIEAPMVGIEKFLQTKQKSNSINQKTSTGIAISQQNLCE